MRTRNQSYNPPQVDATPTSGKLEVPWLPFNRECSLPIHRERAGARTEPWDKHAWRHHHTQYPVLFCLGNTCYTKKTGVGCRVCLSCASQGGAPPLPSATTGSSALRTERNHLHQGLPLPKPPFFLAVLTFLRPIPKATSHFQALHLLLLPFLISGA